MTKRFITLITLLVLAGGIFSCQQKTRFTLNTFQTSSGWGYSIYKNDKLYIKQEYIPAVPGLCSFKNKLDARNTGALVLRKIKERKLPLIKVSELDSLEVQYSKVEKVFPK